MRKQRPGIFKQGHKKLGGRKKGTPNLVNRNLIQAIVQAAEQVGSDGKGKDGVDGYLQMLAGEKAPYFVGLLRQAVQKQVPAIEPENEVIYSTEQEFRQALLDSGIHPTLLPPPPRDFNERPPLDGNLKPPKPPPGWEWVLHKANEYGENDQVNSDQTDESDLNREEDAASGETEETGQPYPGSPRNPVPGYPWDFDPVTNSWFPKGRVPKWKI